MHFLYLILPARSYLIRKIRIRQKLSRHLDHVGFPAGNDLFHKGRIA